MTDSDDSQDISSDEPVVGDWKQADKDDLDEKMREGARRAKESNKTKIENPNSEKSHQIFKKASVEFQFRYEVVSDTDENTELLQYVSEERLEDGEPMEHYRCLCGAHSMSEEEAIQHIKRS